MNPHFYIRKYGLRSWAVYYGHGCESDGLVAVTLYKRGAKTASRLLNNLNSLRTDQTLVQSIIANS